PVVLPGGPREGRGPDARAGRQALVGGPARAVPGLPRRGPGLRRSALDGGARQLRRQHGLPRGPRGQHGLLGVRVPGGLVSFGDGHYAMGDGEIMGTAIEGALNVELTVDLLKHRETPWPRIENDEWMMSVGAARPLEDAARVAFKDMVL